MLEFYFILYFQRSTFECPRLRVLFPLSFCFHKFLLNSLAWLTVVGWLAGWLFVRVVVPPTWLVRRLFIERCNASAAAAAVVAACGLVVNRSGRRRRLL